MAEGLDKSHALKLALTGTIAGVLSGLVGVGGATAVGQLVRGYLGARKAAVDDSNAAA